MKILGASGLISGDEALNQIPPEYLDDGDACVALYNNKFHWYELVDGHGGSQVIPNVVLPIGGGATTKRWVLRNVYLTSVEVEEVLTNSIAQLDTSIPLNLNGVASLSGDVFTFTNTLAAPFEVSSQIMVENLNAEYWGGIHWSEFNLDSLLDSGDQYIPDGVSEIYVAFPERRYNITYSLFTEIYNIGSSSPSLITHMVTSKTMYGFTIKMSTTTDNPFYRVQWAVLGENIDAAEYDLQDTYGNNLQDNTGNQFTVF